VQELPYEAAGAVYFSRWGVEVHFDVLKNRFEISNFAGILPAAICHAGWDALGNCLAFGALQGIHDPPTPSKVLPAFGENGIDRTIALLPRSPSLGCP
jgi:hypothetical protein